MTTPIKFTDVPKLDIDALRTLTPIALLERSIVANLIAYMEERGFSVVSVDDGEFDNTNCIDMKSAMELIFNLDEAFLFFIKKGSSHCPSVMLVLGNGVDVISNWYYSIPDIDGFKAAIDEFDPESFVL